ncbi:MAG: hypothetical protein IKM36_04295 [Oscillospiraceae bacterium]|nr:hypothetical protein [Oscillospiraceae bacterium]MBR2977979.1 hypothetical protein [Oscillospiraceae bacterium]MBR3849696.1 hypothetical protein [Oscillospiraceae bacterium]
MEQEKKYLYPDGETPLMKYLGKKMGEVPEKEEVFLYLEAYDGTLVRVPEEVSELWLEYQAETKRAVEAGEIEDPDEAGKREAQEQWERIKARSQKRCELLNWLSENNVHSRITRDLLTPMEGKTDEEKEQIAAEALARMKALSAEELAKLQRKPKTTE